MAELARRLTNFFVRHGVLLETQRTTYAYCFELVFVFASNFIAILIIAAVTKTFLPTVFYLIGFWPLRMLAGGYHAKTPGHCFCMTLFFFALFLLSLFCNTKIQSVLIWIFVFFSVFVMFLVAPIESPNKRFREGQREQLRRKSRFTVSVLAVTVICGVSVSIRFSYALSCGMAVTAVSLILAILLNGREGSDNRWLRN